LFKIVNESWARFRLQALWLQALYRLAALFYPATGPSKTPAFPTDLIIKVLGVLPLSPLPPPPSK
jgi:hypothetical protein